MRDKVGKDFRTEEIKFIQTVSDIDIEKIARECERIIKETIQRKAKNPTGNLASGFYAEKIKDGWGVGDIAQLDSNLPYWNHIDKGSLGIGANWDHYLPKGFWANGRWIVNANGYAGIKPKTPIPAMNYIAETIQQLEIAIPTILK
jgi:hypothetical protein